ncbi:MAG: UDP-N-acetylglucosamine 2-epimerase [Candidatus Omnitrophota bacterium]
MRKIGVVTTSRADYSIYRPVLLALRRRRVAFELYVTGTHLHKAFGESIRAIEQDGFPIAARIRVVPGASPRDISRTMGRVTTAFADVLEAHKPDILVVLGDRFEMHAMAVAAIPFGIPLAHIHGGELTHGAIDDMFRHSLTKLSALHFASTAEYARRIRQMGEEASRVIVSGAPGLVFSGQRARLTKEDIIRQFHIDFDKDVFLITFHPVTQEYVHTGIYIRNLLDALAGFNNAFFVFTGTNADTSYDVIEAGIRGFIKKRKDAVLVRNFGPEAYAGMLDHARIMVGNSSSGIIEAASHALPVVNIGTRQAGRVRAVNVIDAGYGTEDIRRAISRGLSAGFRQRIKGVSNPYFRPDAAEIVADTLCAVDLPSIRSKEFKDIYGRSK